MEMRTTLNKNISVSNFEKLSEGSEILDMTSEGLVEMFESDFADTCAEKNCARIAGGTSGTVKCAQMVREGHHRIKRK